MKRQTIITTGAWHQQWNESHLQSWTKVLGTVLQYIHIFLSFLGSLLKQRILFAIFLQFFPPPPPPTYTKLKLGKILDTRVQHCLWGEGRGWTRVNWKTPQKCNSVSKLLSMIVVQTNVKPGRFYILLKIHKTENPGRPIVSSNSHPTERLSQFVDYHTLHKHST